jgi:RNA polymerase sigma-70 factor (ECF subfamily)
MADASTSQLQVWINRMNAGEALARDELINRACERLRRLTRKMFHDFGRLKPWEEPEDVLQNAVLRLLRALQVAPPASVGEFFRLAAVQIRRELIDLARHYYGPEGPGPRQATPVEQDGSGSTPPPPFDKPCSTNEPSRLAMWSEFHAQVEALPQDERDVFYLLWYQGLTQAEAAAVLDISLRTVRRRWLAARVGLGAALKDIEKRF